MFANISIHTIVLQYSYFTIQIIIKNANKLYFRTTTVRITVVLHPAGMLLQVFTCIHPGQ